jgi:hypothetical protein
MLLGTLLGDGNLTKNPGALFPRYRANHGFPQKDYCLRKYWLLKDHVGTPPKDVPNKGFGTTSVVFSTLSDPEFEFLEMLCLRPNPAKLGKLKKVVTPEWVAELTWEAVAWWFMDDGSRQDGSLTIATHSFSKPEVELLCGWLTNHGCPAHPELTRKGPKKEYWTIRIPTDSAPIFKQKVDPFILPMMRYKLETAGPRGQVFNCTFCGDSYQNKTLTNPEIPCCYKPECKKTRNWQRGARWEAKIGQPERYRRTKEKLEADPERKTKERAERTAKQQERFQDPAYREAHNAWRREHRRKRKGAGLPRS